MNGELPGDANAEIASLRCHVKLLEATSAASHSGFMLMAGGFENAVAEVERLRAEISRLEEASLPDGFVKWLTITRGPTGRLHAHWPSDDTRGCLVTRELMEEMLCKMAVPR